MKKENKENDPLVCVKFYVTKSEKEALIQKAKDVDCTLSAYLRQLTGENDLTILNLMISTDDVEAYAGELSDICRRIRLFLDAIGRRGTDVTKQDAVKIEAYLEELVFLMRCQYNRAVENRKAVIRDTKRALQKAIRKQKGHAGGNHQDNSDS